MPKVFRRKYTRPIPANAKRVTIKGKHGEDVPAVRFKGRDGRTITAPVATDPTRCRVESPIWYGLVNGEPVPLYSDRAASESRLADLVRQADRRAAGYGSDCEEHLDRPLAEHLDDFTAELLARDNVPRYVATVRFRLDELFAGCLFVSARDFDANRAAVWLADLRSKRADRPQIPTGQTEFTRDEVADLLGVQPCTVPKAVSRHHLAAAGKGRARRYPRSTVEALLRQQEAGASIGTSNAYLRHLKSFAGWLVEAGRLPSNPFARLEPGNVDEDRRHHRRELTGEELQRLLTVTRESKRTFRGLSGESRFHLYVAACGTGFRAGGLASLTRDCFDLGADPPIVTLPVRSDKSRRGKVQPLPEDVAALLAGHLDGMAFFAPVWGDRWLHDAAMMMRADLADASIPYVVEGPDGPLFADFHALRHTYLTVASESGIDLRTVQELAGHSSPDLTARYSHRRLGTLAREVQKMPPLLSESYASLNSGPATTEQQQATGSIRGDD